VALIDCEPAARLVVLNCAEPAEIVPEPICIWPSRNITVPVAVPEPDCGVT
jgi:hypothetical protein